MARGRTRKNTANAATATAPARRGRGNNKPQVAFACKLALNQWLLSLFHVKRFEELAEHLQREDLEGLDENNVHRFHLELSKQFTDLPALPVSQLLEYDQNIVRHTLRLCCSLCLLENDPSVIEPDVLSKDRDKFEASGDAKYVDKAHRRGKIGWNVGRRIEVAPHYRRPHMALVWTGRGRTVPRVVSRRGSVVHRELVEKVPSGFGENPG